MPRITALIVLLSCAFRALAADSAAGYDIVVYGGTPAGVTAAVAAARHGRTVALLDLNAHLGGVVSGGLTSTDVGDPKTHGGLCKEFFARIVKHYTETYGPDSRQLAMSHSGWKFEPHVAEMVFDQLVAGQKSITVFKRCRYHSCTVDQNAVTSITVQNPIDGSLSTFTGKIFIDASYEGDLMAGAKVPYRVGREARSEFGEYLAGVNMGPREFRGTADHRTMSYNYRVSITSSTANRVLAPKPANYTPEPFAKTDGAAIKAGRVPGFLQLYAGREKSAGPNDKFDSNWADFVGNSEGYAEGDWITRDRIAQRQRDHVTSRIYYLQNDPDLPASFREDARKWGFPADEFKDNGNFPFQLYIREARRMVGRYVLREQDLTQNRSKPDGVCAGSYGIDCHTIQRILHEGKQVLEHTRHVSVDNYDIPYACMTPLEPGNLLVPVCLSTTHVAYCSVRMEPVFMMLGHAAGDAAHLALAGKMTVQQVDPQKLRELLKSEGAIVDAGYCPPVKITWSPEHPRPGQSVKFKAVLGDLKDPITDLWWDLEGDGKVSSTGPEPAKAFALDKIYNISLVAKDKAGRRRMVTAQIPVGAAIYQDVTMDEFDADLFGRWNGAYPEMILGKDVRWPDVFTGPGTHFDEIRNGKKAPARARFQPEIPRTGRYLVLLGFRPARNQAPNVPLLIKHARGNTKLTINQQLLDSPFPFAPLGEFEFKQGSTGFVEISNGNTTGRVALDSVRWLWLGE